MNSPALAPERIASDVSAALGQAPVDLVLRGGQIVNVYSGEIHPGDVAIYRGKIVAIREKFTGPAKKRLDITGRFVAPALVDSVFRKDVRLARPAHARGTGMIANAASLPKNILRQREIASDFVETRRALRNGRTAFLDERVGPQALGVLLEEVRCQGLDFGQICFALDPEKPASGKEHPVRVAMNSGFAAPQAFQLATLNPAVHYGIDDRTGSVVPGRVANLLIFDDLEAMRPVRIIHEGAEAALT